MARRPLSVQRQLSEENGQLVFRGWMTSRQQAELSEFKDSLPWQCTVQKLFEASQAKPPIKGKVEYLADHSALAARGFVSDELRDALKALGGDEQWNKAVDTLYTAGQRETTVPAPLLPSGFQIPASLQGFLSYDRAAHELVLRGPMSVAVRDKLARANFPQVHPLSAEARNRFRGQLNALGSPLNAEQAAALESRSRNRGYWTSLRLPSTKRAKPSLPEPTPCEMAQAQAKAGDNAAASDIAKAQIAAPIKRSTPNSGPTWINSPRHLRKRSSNWLNGCERTARSTTGKPTHSAPFSTRSQRRPNKSSTWRCHCCRRSPLPSAVRFSRRGLPDRASLAKHRRRTLRQGACHEVPVVGDV